MAQHRSITLPPAGLTRALHLAAVARETWPNGTEGLSATPADPEAAGWTRLTPAPA